MALPPDLDGHLRQVVKALTTGRLVPFLGAGANLCDRPDGLDWKPDQREHLPLGNELAKHLTQSFGIPESADLSRVSQYVALLNGTGPLYEELHHLLDADYPIPRLHHFLAGLPAALRASGLPRTSDASRRRFLLVTTNYDDLLERALREAGEEFHAVIYEADGKHKGTFLHEAPDGGMTWIDRPNEYRGLLADELPVVLKIHGAVARTRSDSDSFVITEDHYIEYLTRTDAAALIPTPLPALLRNSQLLFLGYSLRDWNLRVILHRLWEDQKLTWRSWAIQRHPDPLDQKFWNDRNVDILDVPLGDYVTWLEQQVRALPPAAGAP